MPKVTTLLCSRKYCKRVVGGKWKTCQHHRDLGKKSKRKRKEKAAKRTAKEGHRVCPNCCREQSVTQFKSCHSRRETLVKDCATCRASRSKSHRNETTKVGKCRKVWKDWRDSHSCQVCGYTGQCIEADHPLAQKVHNCSDYNWWASNGGPEAQAKELLKCRPLCTFDHRLHSQKMRGVCQQPCMVKKRTYVNAYKLKIGKCELCGREVEGEKKCCAFDLDHLDQSEKRDSISVMVAHYSLKKFFACIDEEMKRDVVRLLCCMCHYPVTQDQNKENRAEHMIAAKSRSDTVVQVV
jgi:hypothetical protein